MMYLKKVKIGNTGKRVALVEMKFFSNYPKEKTLSEHYFLVGELQFMDDDANIRLEFDLVGTIKYEMEEDAINAYKSYGEQ